MRLVSFNVMHGRSLVDGRVDADRLRAAVRWLSADVLALQEVDRHQPRSDLLDLAAVAADGMGVGDGHWRFEPALYGTPGGRWWAVDGRPDGAAAPRAPAPRTAAPGAAGPAYGLGLVSRLPVLRWQVVRLGRVPVKSPVVLPDRRPPVRLVEDEPRIGLAAVVETPAGVMTVVTTHLSFVPGWNLVQLVRLVWALRALPEPVVLLGDLNVPGPVPGLAPGWRSLARVRTYPAPEPRLQLDHVLARGPLPPVRRASAELLEVSDHRAVVVDLADPARAPSR